MRMTWMLCGVVVAAGCGRDAAPPGSGSAVVVTTAQAPAPAGSAAPGSAAQAPAPTPTPTATPTPTTTGSGAAGGRPATTALPLATARAPAGTVTGSGVPSTIHVTPPSFHTVELSGAFDCDVVVGGAAGSAPTVDVSGDDNLVPILTVETRGDVLRVAPPDGITITSHLPLRVRIATPALDGLRDSGSSTTTIVGLHADTFTLDVSGSSTIRLAGTAKRLAATVRGAGTIDAGGLAADTATVDATGAPTVTVGPATTLDVTASGAGTIRYRGQPAVTRHVTGPVTVVGA